MKRTAVRTVKCSICGRLFKTSAPNIKYCSLNCKESGTRARRARWEVNNPRYNSEYIKGHRKGKRWEKNEDMKWIPVSEKIPDEGVSVLCTILEYCDYPDIDKYDVPETFVCEGYYHYGDRNRPVNGWYIKVRPDTARGTQNVVAWMPLPKSYAI